MKNSRRITAAILAAALCASPVLNANSELINSIMPVNTITASAAKLNTYGDWEFTISSGTATICGYKGSDTNVHVPQAVKIGNTGYTVTALGVDPYYSKGTFENNKNIKYVAIPRGVKTIGKRTFSGASNLTQVVLPDGIKTISDDAFSNTSISSITLPNTLEEIGNYAFYTTKLKYITIPASVKKFGYFVFCNTPSFENINVTEATLEKILDTQFLTGSTNLTKINNIQVVKYNKLNNNKPYFTAEYEFYMKKHFGLADSKDVPFLVQYVNGYVKYVVKTETASCTTDEQKIRKLHDWVCDKVDYAYTADGKPDNNKECHCDASVFLRNTTVCDGYARALTLLLREAGFEAYYAYTGGPIGEPGHAWTIVKLGNNYYHIDACHDDGKGKGNRQYDHYLVSEKDLNNRCGSHSNWQIGNPTGDSYADKYHYTVPKTKPVCNYTWK